MSMCAFVGLVEEAFSFRVQAPPVPSDHSSAFSETPAPAPVSAGSLPQALQISLRSTVQAQARAAGFDGPPSDDWCLRKIAEEAHRDPRARSALACCRRSGPAAALTAACGPAAPARLSKCHVLALALFLFPAVRRALDAAQRARDSSFDVTVFCLNTAIGRLASVTAVCPVAGLCLRDSLSPVGTQSDAAHAGSGNAMSPLLCDPAALSAHVDIAGVAEMSRAHNATLYILCGRAPAPQSLDPSDATPLMSARHLRSSSGLTVRYGSAAIGAVMAPVCAALGLADPCSLRLLPVGTLLFVQQGRCMALRHPVAGRVQVRECLAAYAWNAHTDSWFITNAPAPVPDGASLATTVAATR